MRKPRFLLPGMLSLFFSLQLIAQPTFPENGVADPRHGYYAFTHATIVKDAATTLTNATMIIKDGRIVSVGAGLAVPAGAVEIDCKGKYIYPSLLISTPTTGHHNVQQLQPGLVSILPSNRK